MIKYLVLFIAVLLMLFNATAVFAQDRNPLVSDSAIATSSYELFYPITAGKVLGDPLYFLKQIKEKLREILIFGTLQKAEYDLTLSEKRMVEAEYLYLVKKDINDASQTLENANARQVKVVELIQSMKENKQDAADILTAKVKDSFNRQLSLLKTLEIKIPNQKNRLEQIKYKLEELLGKL